LNFEGLKKDENNFKNLQIDEMSSSAVLERSFSF
jgi:hypothetical protein